MAQSYSKRLVEIQSGELWMVLERYDSLRVDVLDEPAALGALSIAAGLTF